MKSIKILFGVFVTLAVMITFNSCKDEIEYHSAEKLTSAQVFFPSTNSSSVSLSSQATTYEIPVSRIKTDDAINVPLTLSGGEGLYSIPSQVSFEAGQANTVIVLTYDPDVVGFDSFSELTISLGDDVYSTPYGMSKYTVSVGIPAPWVSLGNCTFIEDFLTTFFGVDNVPYEVEIQENQLQPGFFRLVNPFGEAYPYNEPGDWDDSRDWYLEIHAEDPSAVYMNIQQVGMNWGYGMFSVGSLAGYYMGKGQTLEEVKAAGHTGTYENGVITFPVKSMLISMAEYNNGGLYTANNNGAFTIAMPGVVLADYSVGIAYGGRYMDPQDSIMGVMTQINEVGEDVESIRIAVVLGTDVAAAVAGIIDGSIESIEVAPNPATVLVPFTEEAVEDRYTIVAVTYGGGEAQDYASVNFKFTSLAESSETWTPRYTGDYVYKYFFGTEEAPETDTGLVLYQSDKDAKRWKIEHWGGDVDFIFTFDQTTGEILVADQEVGYVHSQYGAVFVDDLVDYTGEVSYGYSYYDSGVFYFAVVYYVDAGEFDYGIETFTLTGNASSPTKAKAPRTIKSKSKVSHSIIRENLIGQPFIK